MTSSMDTADQNRARVSTSLPSDVVLAGNESSSEAEVVEHSKNRATTGLYSSLKKLVGAAKGAASTHVVNFIEKQ